MDTLGKRLAQGDHAAFAELYDACADRIHHYLMVILGSKEDAEDALQETFIRLAGNCKRLAKVENLIAYTFTIARNEALRLAGRRKTAASLGANAERQRLFEKVEKNNPGANEYVEAATMVLSRLDPDLREIVELKFFAGLTFREIADVTACPQGTAATRYRTALEKMRAILAKDWT
ncbi:MAG: RNA polymerase sigma factor [Thermoguttaceae bacterium]|jgi:RNA polymerase sigma-70 factor (ECF subfamily)